MSAHQRVRIVELSAVQEIKAAWIDNDPRARLFDDEVILRWHRCVQVELVLEAAAAAG